MLSFCEMVLQVIRCVCARGFVHAVLLVGEPGHMV